MHVVLWVQDWGWSRHKRSWIIHWICLCWAMKWNSNTAWNKVKLLRHKACYKQEKNSVLGLSLWDVSNPWVWGQDGYQWLKERSYICIKRSQTLPHRKSGVTLTLKHTHTHPTYKNVPQERRLTARAEISPNIVLVSPIKALNTWPLCQKWKLDLEKSLPFSSWSVLYKFTSIYQLLLPGVSLEQWATGTLSVGSVAFMGAWRDFSKTPGAQPHWNAVLYTWKQYEALEIEKKKKTVF